MVKIPSCSSPVSLPVAIKTMNKVASHINEMQKIHEEYGAVFDQLIAEQTGEKKEVKIRFREERAVIVVPVFAFPAVPLKLILVQTEKSQLSSRPELN